MMLAVFHTVRKQHAPLAWLSVLMIAFIIVSALGYALDGRMLVGARIWAKPLKFSISFMLYGVTLGWMITQVPSKRLRSVAWWAGTGLALASALEVAAIGLQVVRGTQSHFNVATNFDSAVFISMAIFVSIVYLCTLVIGVALLWRPLRSAAFTWALRLGVVIAVAGLSVGFLMLHPTPEQAALGEQATLRGAHGVGAPDGGPGLPFVGWSTTTGDLRISHFIGMHALQVLPLLALALGSAAVRRRLRFTDRTRLHIVLLFSAVYGGVVALTLWQALRGQALLSPDGLTLAAVGGLLVVTALGAAAVVRAARRPPLAAT